MLLDNVEYQIQNAEKINEVKYLIEEREDLEKVRILNEIKKEKVMKFDFEKGKQELLEYFEICFDRLYLSMRDFLSSKQFDKVIDEFS